MFWSGLACVSDVPRGCGCGFGVWLLFLTLPLELGLSRPQLRSSPVTGEQCRYHSCDRFRQEQNTNNKTQPSSKKSILAVIVIPSCSFVYCFWILSFYKLCFFLLQKLSERGFPAELSVQTRSIKKEKAACNLCIKLTS